MGWEYSSYFSIYLLILLQGIMRSVLPGEICLIATLTHLWHKLSNHLPVACSVFVLYDSGRNDPQSWFLVSFAKVACAMVKCSLCGKEALLRHENRGIEVARRCMVVVHVPVGLTVKKGNCEV